MSHLQKRCPVLHNTPRVCDIAAFLCLRQSRLAGESFSKTIAHLLYHLNWDAFFQLQTESLVHCASLMTSRKYTTWSLSVYVILLYTRGIKSKALVMPTSLSVARFKIYSALLTAEMGWMTLKMDKPDCPMKSCDNLSPRFSLHSSSSFATAESLWSCSYTVVAFDIF